MTRRENLAPIALFVYNRLEYLRQTVEALQKNELAADSDLIVFCDGPKNLATANDFKKINAVRDYVKVISGFKSVSVIENVVNKGLSNAIFSGVTEVIHKYGKVIVLEDDLVTSPYFLRFMNEGLERKKDDGQKTLFTKPSNPNRP